MDRDRSRDTDRDRDREPVERGEKSSTPIEREGTSRARHTDEAGSATARCKDGHLSYSKHHSGTCSDHGGVAEWLVD